MSVAITPIRGRAGRRSRAAFDGEEWAGIDALSRRADLAKSEVLSPWAWTRRTRLYERGRLLGDWQALERAASALGRSFDFLDAKLAEACDGLHRSLRGGDCERHPTCRT